MAQIAWEDVTYTIPKARSSADMTNKQHYITKYHTTENQHALGAAAADVLSGIAQSEPNAANKSLVVATKGVSKCVAGGTIAIGDLITSDSAGKGVAAAPAGGTNNWIVGTALQIAAAGEKFSVLLSVQRIQG